MAKLNKNLTKRQKQIRITKLQKQFKIKFKKEQVKKLFRLKSEKSFTKRSRQLAGAIRGGKTTRMLYSSNAIRVLKRQERSINKRLEKDPTNKELGKAKLKVTIRLDRALERKAKTPQEKEMMIYRHRKNEVELASKVAKGEKISPSKHGWTREDFVKEFFASQYNQWKDDLENEKSELVAKADELSKDDPNNELGDVLAKIEEIEQKLEDSYQNFFNEEIADELDVAVQHNGNLVYGKDDYAEIIYQS